MDVVLNISCSLQMSAFSYLNTHCCSIMPATPLLTLHTASLLSLFQCSVQIYAFPQQEQDPAVFGDAFAKISRATLRIRYSLLPYLYTLFYESHVHGSTVVRSLMHE